MKNKARNLFTSDGLWYFYFLGSASRGEGRIRYFVRSNLALVILYSKHIIVDIFYFINLHWTNFHPLCIMSSSCGKIINE